MIKYFIKESLEKIKKELKYLKTAKRKEIAKELSHAASFGDLSENAAYREAKDAKEFLERRIIELEEEIRNAQVIKKNGKSNKVQIGSIVFLKSDLKGEKFEIVDSSQSNPFKGKISYESPLGESLLGKKVGEVVELETPQGRIKYKIIKIE